MRTPLCSLFRSFDARVRQAFWEFNAPMAEPQEPQEFDLGVDISDIFADDWTPSSPHQCGEWKFSPSFLQPELSHLNFGWFTRPSEVLPRLATAEMRVLLEVLRLRHKASGSHVPRGDGSTFVPSYIRRSTLSSHSYTVIILLTLSGISDEKYEAHELDLPPAPPAPPAPPEEETSPAPRGSADDYEQSRPGGCWLGDECVGEFSLQVFCGALKGSWCELP